MKSRTFIIELYTNYDCDVRCSNALANLSEFLYKAAFPRGGTLTNLHALALDIILSLLTTLERCIEAADMSNNSKGNSSISGGADVQALRREKQRKRVLNQAVEKFNGSAAEGLAFLQSQGLLPTPLDARSVAVFLRETPGLNKGVVGEYVSGRKPFNQAVLGEYVKTFPMRGVRFIDSLRMYMESFLVAGDANIISRMLEAFSKEYYSANTPGSVFKNADVCYVAAYSVIMLNVDLHNKNLKVHMTLEQYIHNTRGINEREDLPRSMLTEIYRTIHDHELKIPEDLPSGLVSARACTDMLARAPAAAPFRPAAAFRGRGEADLYRDAFATMWNPLIAVLSVTFESAEDEATIGRVLGGFRVCGTVAARYGLSEVVDYLVIYLCKAAALPLPPGVENPRLAFGLNRKAHHAAVAAFSIATRHAQLLRESWVNLFAAMGSLHAMDLLPDIPDMPDFAPDADTPSSSSSSSSSDSLKSNSAEVDVDSTHSNEPPTTATAAAAATTTTASSSSSSSGQSSTGWLSALLWGSSSNEPPKLSAEEVEAREAAQNCATACCVYDLLDTCGTVVDDTGLAFVIKALLACAGPAGPATPLHTTAAATATTTAAAAANTVRSSSTEGVNVPSVSIENDAGVSSQTTSGSNSNGNGAFVKGRDDEGSLFSLDILAKVTLSNTHRLWSVWPSVFDYCTRALADAGSGARSTDYVERVASNVLLLAIALRDKAEITRDTVKCLWLLSKIPQRVMADICDVVSLGLADIVARHDMLVAIARAGGISPVFALTRAVAASQKGAARGLAALERLVATEDVHLNPDELTLCMGAISHYIKLSRTISDEEYKLRDPKKQRERLVARDAIALRCIDLLQIIFFRVTNDWNLCSPVISVLASLSRDNSVNTHTQHYNT